MMNAPIFTLMVLGVMSFACWAGRALYRIYAQAGAEEASMIARLQEAQQIDSDYAQYLEQVNQELNNEIVVRRQAESTLELNTKQLSAITDSMSLFLEKGNLREAISILLDTA